MKPLLSLQKVSFHYGEGQQALHDITVEINEGERIAVLGANGAGKSTFFLLCNGILQPAEGSLLLDGNAVSTTKKDLLRLRRQVGVIFQEADNQLLAPTVLGEVSFGPLNLGLSEQEARERTEIALSQLSLSHLRERAPHQLSGGEKKRVCIASVLAMQPRVLLLDEPTSSLDPAGSEQLEEILHALSASGMTLLLSTHDIDFACRFADRVLLFCEGILLADGPAAQILADEALLRKAGLRQPTCYHAATLLWQQLYDTVPPLPYPRTATELAHYFATHKGEADEI